ncbi:serpin family protein, partial [Marinilabilia sp.]
MKLTLIFAIMISFLSGCNQSESNEKPSKKELELKSKNVLEATDRFGWELLQTVNGETEPGKNVVISSLSVAQALGMTTNGAANETLNQMLEVMDFGEVSEMNDAFQNIREVLQTADPKVQVDIANSVWYRQGMPAKESFGEALERYYDAVFREVDFSRKQEAKDLINGWVNDKTRGKIPTIVDEIQDAQFMFLINAVYFLGKWQYEFDKSATQDDDFTLSDGSTIQVPMMNQET